MTDELLPLLLGALTGGGAAAVVAGLHSGRPSLAAQITAARTRGGGNTAGIRLPDSGAGWAGRAGRMVVPVARSLGLPTASLRADLEVAGVPVDRHMAEKATGLAVGLVAPPLLCLLVSAGAEVEVGWWLPAWLTLAFALVLYAAPELAVRRLANERRKELLHTMAVIADLAAIALAGGVGVQQALDDAAAQPVGWAATQIRGALAAAAATRTSMWDQLHQLGHRHRVREIRELAATVALAGSEGARIRTSLAAKSAGLRERQLAEADGAAQAATERMSLPIVLLLAGFLVFIGYPALATVMGGL